MENLKTDTVWRIGRGFIEGAGVDMMMYALTAYIPQLKEPSPIPIPGYAAAGTHYDDLISLAISGIVTGVGAYKRDVNMAVEGVGMLIGNFIASQFQQCEVIPPFSVGQVNRSPVQSTVCDLVRID